MSFLDKPEELDQSIDDLPAPTLTESPPEALEGPTAKPIPTAKATEQSILAAALTDDPERSASLMNAEYQSTADSPTRREIVNNVRRDNVSNTLAAAAEIDATPEEIEPLLQEDANPDLVKETSKRFIDQQIDMTAEQINFYRGFSDSYYRNLQIMDSLTRDMAVKNESSGLQEGLGNILQLMFPTEFEVGSTAITNQLLGEQDGDRAGLDPFGIETGIGLNVFNKKRMAKAFANATPQEQEQMIKRFATLVDLNPSLQAFSEENGLTKWIRMQEYMRIIQSGGKDESMGWQVAEFIAGVLDYIPVASALGRSIRVKRGLQTATQITKAGISGSTPVGKTLAPNLRIVQGEKPLVKADVIVNSKIVKDLEAAAAEVTKARVTMTTAAANKLTRGERKQLDAEWAELQFDINNPALSKAEKDAARAKQAELDKRIADDNVAKRSESTLSKLDSAGDDIEKQFEIVTGGADIPTKKLEVETPVLQPESGSIPHVVKVEPDLPYRPRAGKTSEEISAALGNVIFVEKYIPVSTADAAAVANPIRYGIGASMAHGAPQYLGQLLRQGDRKMDQVIQITPAEAIIDGLPKITGAASSVVTPAVLGLLSDFPRVGQAVADFEGFFRRLNTRINFSGKEFDQAFKNYVKELNKSIPARHIPGMSNLEPTNDGFRYSAVYGNGSGHTGFNTIEELRLTLEGDSGLDVTKGHYEILARGQDGVLHKIELKDDMDMSDLHGDFYARFTADYRLNKVDADTIEGALGRWAVDMDYAAGGHHIFIEDAGRLLAQQINAALDMEPKLKGYLLRVKEPFDRLGPISKRKVLNVLKVGDTEGEVYDIQTLVDRFGLSYKEAEGYTAARALNDMDYTYANKQLRDELISMGMHWVSYTAKAEEGEEAASFHGIGKVVDGIDPTEGVVQVFNVGLNKAVEASMEIGKNEQVIKLAKSHKVGNHSYQYVIVPKSAKVAELPPYVKYYRKGHIERKYKDGWIVKVYNMSASHNGKRMGMNGPGRGIRVVGTQKLGQRWAKTEAEKWANDHYDDIPTRVESRKTAAHGEHFVIVRTDTGEELSVFRTELAKERSTDIRISSGTDDIEHTPLWFESRGEHLLDERNIPAQVDNALEVLERTPHSLSNRMTAQEVIDEWKARYVATWGDQLEEPGVFSPPGRGLPSASEAGADAHRLYGLIQRLETLSVTENPLYRRAAYSFANGIDKMWEGNEISRYIMNTAANWQPTMVGRAATFTVFLAWHILRSLTLNFMSFAARLPAASPSDWIHMPTDTGAFILGAALLRNEEVGGGILKSQARLSRAQGKLRFKAATSQGAEKAAAERQLAEHVNKHGDLTTARNYNDALANVDQGSYPAMWKGIAKILGVPVKDVKKHVQALRDSGLVTDVDAHNAIGSSVLSQSKTLRYHFDGAKTVTEKAGIALGDTVGILTAPVRKSADLAKRAGFDLGTKGELLVVYSMLRRKAMRQGKNLNDPAVMQQLVSDVRILTGNQNKFGATKAQRGALSMATQFQFFPLGQTLSLTMGDAYLTAARTDTVNRWALALGLIPLYGIDNMLGGWTDDQIAEHGLPSWWNDIAQASMVDWVMNSAFRAASEKVNELRGTPENLETTNLAISRSINPYSGAQSLSQLFEAFANGKGAQALFGPVLPAGSEVAEKIRIAYYMVAGNEGDFSDKLYEASINTARVIKIADKTAIAYWARKTGLMSSSTGNPREDSNRMKELGAIFGFSGKGIEEVYDLSSKGFVSDSVGRHALAKFSVTFMYKVLEKYEYNIEAALRSGEWTNYRDSVTAGFDPAERNEFTREMSRVISKVTGKRADLLENGLATHAAAQVVKYQLGGERLKQLRQIRNTPDLWDNLPEHEKVYVENLIKDGEAFE